MSLKSHEINRANNACETSQFRSTLPIMQKQYQGKMKSYYMLKTEGIHPPKTEVSIHFLAP